eukprot:jgi/Bigna1/86935/estExt_fgenesh1_pg.C_150103
MAASDDNILEGIGNLLAEGWNECKPWSEFIAEFKPPSNLDERVRTNFMYYRGNYCVVTLAFVFFALCIHPPSLLAFIFSALGIFALLSAKIEQSPGNVISPSQKLVGSIPVAILVMVSAGATFWILYGSLIGLLISLMHMVFRSRTLKSRWNTILEEFKR